MTVLSLTQPTQHDSELAQQSSQQLTPYLENNNDSFMQIGLGRELQQVIDIPILALELLASILTEMAQGNAVTLIPVHAELTTQQAADLLNISRPFLVTLLDEGKIPHYKVGTHRRVLAKDVLTFKESQARESAEALRQLAEQAQELNMGY